MECHPVFQRIIEAVPRIRPLDIGLFGFRPELIGQ
jgi:hypothetical protein